MLRSARHQAHVGGQTCEQEADEEGSSDPGTQPAHQTPAPQHHLPDRHLRDPQQLRPRPGDVGPCHLTRLPFLPSTFQHDFTAVLMRPLCFRADQGRLLDYVVSWGNLTEGKVAYYLRDVLEALHYLHSRRIVHLDVKVSPRPPWTWVVIV